MTTPCQRLAPVSQRRGLDAPDRPVARGSALYLVVTMVIIAGAFTTMLSASFAHLLAETRRERASVAALYAAEGGLAYARAALARDPTWASGGGRVGNGEFEARAEPDGSAADRRLVRVRGRVPATDAPGATIERRLAATVRLQPGRLPSVTAWREE